MTSKSDLAIRVRGLSKSYTIAHNAGERHVTLAETLLARARRPFARSARETFWALKDIEFDIKKGDVVGIIGRNGAGKSTLLKILSRIIEPTAGQIDLYGRVGSLLEVGTGFHPELTGRENVFLNGAILGMSKAEIKKQFDAIVDFAGVEQFLDTPVKRYSSGMYVRLAFAVAAHLESEILIVDEVLAVGDAEFQKKCLGKMEDISSHGRTVLFVSHQESAVRRLCKSAILLENGAVAYIGSPADAFAQYRTRHREGRFRSGNRTVTPKHVHFTDASLSIDGVTTLEVNCAREVMLRIHLEVKDRVSFAPEFVIRDANNVPVIFAGPWYSSGMVYECEPGEHSFSFMISLPFLVTGKYSLDLMAVEPCVRYYDVIEEAISFSVTSADSPATGFHYNQSFGRGCIAVDCTEVRNREVPARSVQALKT